MLAAVDEGHAALVPVTSNQVLVLELDMYRTGYPHYGAPHTSHLTTTGVVCCDVTCHTHHHPLGTRTSVCVPYICRRLTV